MSLWLSFLNNHCGGCKFCRRSCYAYIHAHAHIYIYIRTQYLYILSMYTYKCLLSCLIRGARVSDCGNWLIVTPLKDCRDNLIFFTPLKAGMKITANLPLTRVVDVLEADYEVSNERFTLS